MKKTAQFLFAIAAAVVAFNGRADALMTQFTSKQVVVSFSVTPSPSPSPVAVFGAPRPEAGLGIGTVVFASLVEPAAPIVLAQARQGNTPVSINVKPDPTAAYLRIVPNTTTYPNYPNFPAQYGSNTYPCAFQVYAYFTNAWVVNDWVYGTTANGAGSGFPTYNYPTTSALSWSAEGISTAYTSFANNGTPGQTTFTGTAKVAKTVCIDLQLTVPASIAPGTYSAPLQYTLSVTT